MSHSGGELEHSKCPIFETKDTIDLKTNILSRDKFLGVVSHSGNKTLAGLADFDCRIL